MKNILTALLLTISTNTFSGTYSASGKIEDILIPKDIITDLAIIYIQNLTDAGTCKKYSAKNMVITTIEQNEKGKAMLSLALSAYMAGKEVAVEVNDTDIDDIRGYCRLQRIRINTQF